jgi:hypothetical protein
MFATVLRRSPAARAPRFAYCLGTLALVLAFARSAKGEPSGCTNLDAVPVQFTIDYQSAIQGIFDNHCIECHAGKPPLPADLDLGAGGSWSHLINVSSSQDPLFTRVVPNRPEESLLFLKVNCDTPGLGHRMPFGAEPLQPEEQALILDWIVGGAPSSVTDTIFRGGFEIRG